jgi:hypothetical protein
MRRCRHARPNNPHRQRSRPAPFRWGVDVRSGRTRRVDWHGNLIEWGAWFAAVRRRPSGVCNPELDVSREPDRRHLRKAHRPRKLALVDNGRTFAR